MTAIRPPITKLPYTQEELEDNLITFANILKKRAERDWDATVAISGEEGVSKSTLAFWLGQEIDPKFEFERNELFAVEIKDILEKITDPKIRAIIGDEAIKWLYKRNWQTRGQTFINQLYTLCRKENKITILCIPRFVDLNEYFRNHRVKYWIYCIHRGLAVIFIRDWSPFTIKDPWWMNDNQKRIENMKGWKNLDIKKKIKMLSRCRGYLMVIGYPDMPDDVKQRYKEVKNKYVYEGEVKRDMSAEISQTKLREKEVKLNMIKYLMLHDKKSMKQTGEIMGINNITVKSLISEEEWYKNYVLDKVKTKRDIFRH